MLMHVAWARRINDATPSGACAHLWRDRRYSTCWRVVSPPALHILSQGFGCLEGETIIHPSDALMLCHKLSGQSPRLFGRPSACLRRRKTWRCKDRELETQSCRDPKDSRELVHRCQTHRVPTFREIAVRLDATATHTCARPITYTAFCSHLKLSSHLPQDYKRGLRCAAYEV
jgi:hypothetical protein